MNMSKTKSTIIKIAAIIIAFGSIIFTKICIEATKDYLRDKSNAREIKSSSEKLANTLNKQCPLELDSWTTIQEVTMNDKKVDFKCEVDEDVIDALSPDGYKVSFIRIFKSQMNKVEMMKFGKKLNKAEIEMRLLIYRSNGDLEKTIVITGNDFIYPPYDISEKKEKVIKINGKVVGVETE